MNEEKLISFAEIFAFIGNSLLAPMSQTESVGLDPSFWAAFPNFGSDKVAQRIDRCAKFAENSSIAISKGEDVVEQVSVEYTKLFIGPPSPAAPPWETMNREEDVSVGFGQPTFEMISILRKMGLEVSNPNNQYADHIGLELLTLSEMCRRVAAGNASNEGYTSIEDILLFTSDHPLAWITTLYDKVCKENDAGYYAGLLDLAKAMMEEMKVSASE